MRSIPRQGTNSPSSAPISPSLKTGRRQLSEDAAASRALIQSVIEQLLARDAAPISLGGDHSITIQSASIAKHHEGVTILHIDAHGDVYDEFEGEPLFARVPVRAVMEERLCARRYKSGLHTDAAPTR